MYTWLGDDLFLFTLSVLNIIVQGGGYVGALAALREKSFSHCIYGATGHRIRRVFPCFWQLGRPSWSYPELTSILVVSPGLIRKQTSKWESSNPSIESCSWKERIKLLVHVKCRLIFNKYSRMWSVLTRKWNIRLRQSHSSVPVRCAVHLFCCCYTLSPSWLGATHPLAVNFGAVADRVLRR